MDILLEATTLTRYYGETIAVNALSFSLRRGEVAGLLGLNGAGKSTTLKMLSGVLTPTSGVVRVGGRDIRSDARVARAEIGFLPDRPPLYRELKVDEYLNYCAALRGVTRAKRKTAVSEVKARCGLENYGKRLLGQLSKGFQQRVGIAQALVHNPAVVILDEPTVGLDPLQIRELRKLIRSLGENHAVILSTHILPEVQAVCDRVLVIDAGRLVLTETLAALRADARARRYTLRFMQTPETAALQVLPGIEAVDPLASDEVEVVTNGLPATLETLLRAALDNGWGLRAMLPNDTSLEKLFSDIVTGERSSTVYRGGDANRT